jgi:hypothetical protein
MWGFASGFELSCRFRLGHSQVTGSSSAAISRQRSENKKAAALSEPILVPPAQMQ